MTTYRLYGGGMYLGSVFSPGGGHGGRSRERPNGAPALRPEHGHFVPLCERIAEELRSCGRSGFDLRGLEVVEAAGARYSNSALRGALAEIARGSRVELSLWGNVLWTGRFPTQRDGG